MGIKSGLLALVKHSIRFSLKAMMWIVIVFLLFAISLFYREQRLPESWVDAITEKCAPTNLVVRCEGASFGFRHGVRLSGVAVFDRERKHSLDPVVKAAGITVDFIRNRVVATELEMKRLPDSYYRPGNKERNSRVDAGFPEIPDFSLVLHRPHILGVKAEKVTAEVSVAPSRLDVSGINLVWPDIDRRMELNGFTYVDFDAQRVYGEVRGEAKQSNIRPLLVALDIPVSLPYFDAFTEVELPVPAFCSWDVNLVNNDLMLKLDLSPTMGRYNGVPMRKADGELSIHVYTRGDKLNFNTRIGPIKAFDTENRILDGSMLIRGTNDVTHIDFDVDSDLRLPDALDIIGYFNDGTLDCLQCDTAPKVSVKGTLAVDEGYEHNNNLAGSVSFASGKFFDIPVKDVSFDYTFIGNRLSFLRGRVTGKDGGTVTGGASITDNPAGTKDSFMLDLKYDGGTMSELADVLELDLGERHGKVDGWIQLTAPLEFDAYGDMDGEGFIRITDGNLAQMELFMGLTKMLAENVPGISGLVTMSQASADFTIVDGVLRSDNVLIEGGLVSIKAKGTYDIEEDDLDFTVRVQLLKKESIIGKMVRPVMLPFSKLLMEFKVTGHVSDPKWKYISVLDRML